VTTGKVLKERRAPRERGRMGSSLTVKTCDAANRHGAVSLSCGSSYPPIAAHDATEISHAIPNTPLMTHAQNPHVRSRTRK